MFQITRDWEAFWETHRDAENGVYGNPNPRLLEYASLFMGGRRGLTAADIASGDGRYAVPLAEMGFDVCAIDSSMRAHDRLRERVLHLGLTDRIHAEVADVFALLPDSRAYDLIVCSGMLEEIPMETHERLIRGLQQWTNPQGMNILRYVTEKKLDPNTTDEVVTVHERIIGLYEGWKKIDTEQEAHYRRARVGRNIGGMTVNRYLRAASVVAVRH